MCLVGHFEIYISGRGKWSSLVVAAAAASFSYTLGEERRGSSSLLFTLALHLFNVRYCGISRNFPLELTFTLASAGYMYICIRELLPSDLFSSLFREGRV